MDILIAISIVSFLAGIAVLFSQSVKRPAYKDLGDASSVEVTETEQRVECWICTSCSQYNRTDQPFYHFDKLRCQNCYEPKASEVDYHPITLPQYWNQAKFAQEHERREAERTSKKPWIDPSIAPKSRHTINFKPPRKEMPDDLKDKISRN